MDSRELLKSVEEMDNIDSTLVKEEWMTVDFAKFRFFNARHISCTPTEGMDKIKQDEGGF